MVTDLLDALKTATQAGDPVSWLFYTVAAVCCYLWSEADIDG